MPDVSRFVAQLPFDDTARENPAYAEELLNGLPSLYTILTIRNEYFC